MKKKTLTNQKVWDEGEVIDDWACDTNMETGECESNGSVEYEVLYKGKKYYIITDWAGDKVFKPNKPAREVDEET